MEWRSHRIVTLRFSQTSVGKEGSTFYLHYPGSLLPVLSLEVMRTGRDRDFNLLV